MRGRSVICFTPLVLIVLAGLAAADGPVQVRGVQVRDVKVRDVRVDEPVPAKQRDQRRSSGVSRPVDPGIISRPPSTREPAASSPRQSGRDRSADRDGRRRHGRDRFYAFKPWFSTGYGVIVGYPVIYPYAYPYDPFSPTPFTGTTYTPWPNRNTYTTNSNVNTYSNVDSITTAGNVAAALPTSKAVACESGAPCGGVSFEISPASAQVWVDGVYTGVVADFDPTTAPLLLAPGDHYVELRLTGYRTASFDATITAGEVTPYQGTLERLRLQTP